MTIGSKKLTWINGRQLNTYGDGNLSISYKYNENGIRTEKVVNGVKTEYYLEENNIIFEKTDNGIIYYLYDNTGVTGFIFNNQKYYYVKNLQSDIIGIVDSDNNLMVKYEYDSFGNILSIKDSNNLIITDVTNIGNINSFRYRSYYYDKETKFYYLNSRYYNPIWGRFINADGIIGANKDFLSNNLFLYISNNYVNYIDKLGTVIKLFDIRKLKKKLDEIMDSIGETVSNTLEKIATSKFDFVFEIGAGRGFGFGAKGSFGKKNIGFGAKDYQDNTISFSSKKGVVCEYKENTNGYVNPFYYDYTRSAELNCSNNNVLGVSESTSLGIDIEGKSGLNLSIYNDGSSFKSFYGVEADLHIGIGGHAKIGWDVETEEKHWFPGELGENNSIIY